MKRICIGMIRFYQKYLSGLKTQYHCIYTPTCSQYGIEAIEKYGVLKGGLLTAWRLADHSSDSLAAWKAEGRNLQCDGWIIRYPEYRRLHYYFHNYYLYVDDPSYDQTAEVVEDVIRNESGDSEDPEKICRKT